MPNIIDNQPNDINKMVQDNMNLVYYLYEKLPKTNICIQNKDDIVEEGVVGLWKGCKTYDKTKNIKFSYYLSKCINNEMYMYLRLLNRTQNYISLDEIISVDKDGEILKVQDIISDKLNLVDDYFDMNYYIDIYFKHNRKTISAERVIPILLKMLLEGATQMEIAQQLGFHRANVCKYLKKLRSALIIEMKDD